MKAWFKKINTFQKAKVQSQGVAFPWFFVTAQYTANITNSEKATSFLSLKSCSRNKFKSHMFFTCKNGFKSCWCHLESSWLFCVSVNRKISFIYYSVITNYIICFESNCALGTKTVIVSPDISFPFIGKNKSFCLRH